MFGEWDFCCGLFLGPQRGVQRPRTFLETPSHVVRRLHRMAGCAARRRRLSERFGLLEKRIARSAGIVRNTFGHAASVDDDLRGRLRTKTNLCGHTPGA